MKTNYDDIYNRITAILKAIPLLEKENNDQKIENLIKEVSFYNNLINDAINIKKKSVAPCESIKKIIDLEKQYKIMMEYKKLYLLNKNFYEQLDINKILYRLDYCNTLEEYNHNLMKLITILEKFNITFSKDDFNYTEYVKKYMSALLEYKNNEDLNSIMKNVYDGIHWEEQSILENISISIKKVFVKYEKFINEQTNKMLNDYILINNITHDDIKININNLKNDIIKQKEIEPYYIRQLFINTKINPLNYKSDSSLIKNDLLYFNSNYNLLDENSKKQFIENIYNLKNDLDDYNNLIKYDYILLNAENIIKNNDIDDINDDYENTINEISKIDTEYNKLYKQLTKLIDQKNKILGKNTVTFIIEKTKIDKVGKIDNTIKKLKEQLNNLNNDMKELQKEIIDLKFNKTLLDIINDEITIYDILNLYSENNNILYKCIKNKYKLNEIDDIEKIVDDYNNYIDYLSGKIINNTKFNQFNQIKNLIEKKYKLLNIKLDFNDLNNLLTNVNNIYFYRNILISKIDLNKVLIDDN